MFTYTTTEPLLVLGNALFRLARRAQRLVNTPATPRNSNARAAIPRFIVQGYRKTAGDSTVRLL